MKLFMHLGLISLLAATSLNCAMLSKRFLTPVVRLGTQQLMHATTAKKLLTKAPESLQLNTKFTEQLSLQQEIKAKQISYPLLDVKKTEDRILAEFVKKEGELSSLKSVPLQSVVFFLSASVAPQSPLALALSLMAWVSFMAAYENRPVLAAFYL